MYPHCPDVMLLIFFHVGHSRHLRLNDQLPLYALLMNHIRPCRFKYTAICPLPHTSLSLSAQPIIGHHEPIVAVVPIRALPNLGTRDLCAVHYLAVLAASVEIMSRHCTDRVLIETITNLCMHFSNIEPERQTRNENGACIFRSENMYIFSLLRTSYLTVLFELF